MAAISAASVRLSFSSPIRTHLSFLSKNDSFCIKTPLSATRVSLSSSLSQFPILSAALPRKWRVKMVTSSVEQEAAGLTAEAEGEEVTAPAATEEAVRTKLYFGNLPYNLDSSQLAGIVQDYANPELVEVLYNRDTGRSRGFAFVTMSSLEDCNAVIDNLDGREYMGRTLRVNLADKPRARKEPLYPQTEHKLFVGNLAWSVTTESLMQAFQAHGEVVGARVLFDGETGRARGFGFVCYATQPEMEAARAAMDGVELDGRAIRVSLASGVSGQQS